MNEFDIKAAGWDNNQMHWDRSAAIAKEMLRVLPLNKNMNALEFGPGTGILSFMLKDHLKQITLIDNSIEMLKIIDGKIANTNTANLKTLNFDLEHNNLGQSKFDLIFTQMVLHHIADVNGIIKQFAKHLNQNGYLAIADLYKEDGSFHGEGFTGHKGFDIDELSLILKQNGFKNISHTQCYSVKREIPNGEPFEYPIFLLTASI